MFRSQSFLSIALFSLTAVSLSSAPLDRYALVLAEAPVAQQVPTRQALKSSAALAWRAHIQESQRSLRSELAARKISVTGSVSTLANALFVTARPDQVAELKGLPGVVAVARMVRLRPKLNKAIDLVNARAAWSTVGGASQAGAGIKIAIIDTGIDETHPGLTDASLSMPAGFPLGDAAHTTSKVIVAKSYVYALAVGNGTSEATLDDDTSTRDRVGHGTALAMAAAGVSVASPVGTISGVAPKAWLGNYKIFGSPGVNDFTSADVLMTAVEDAYLDGMDIALVAMGILPINAPGDMGAACGQTDPGFICDPFSNALSVAISNGLTIVVPAGDDGGLGLNTIDTPGSIPGIITVGASTNTQDLHQSAVTATPDFLSMRLTNGPQLQAPLTRPLVDVSATSTACSTLPAGSLNGSIALIQRGTCSFATKANYAAAAGAVGILFFREPGGTTLFSPSGLGNSSIPSALVNEDAGKFLKTYLGAHPGGTLTMDPTTATVSTSSPESAAAYSSLGPNLADNGIKPELAAPGNLFTAGQNYDPNGSLYSATRWVGAEGTSFSAALVAGAVALVKQAHPGYSAAQFKSAVTNTAVSGLQDCCDANGNPFDARVIAVGAGKLNVAGAVQSNVTVEPPTVGFGSVTGTSSKSLKVTNTGTASVTLQFAVNQRDTDAKAAVTVSPSTMTLSPKQAAFLTVTLTGIPAAGFYEGVINVSGGAAPLRIPYLYLVSSLNPGNSVPLVGSDFVIETGTGVEIWFKITDGIGLALGNVPISFAPQANISGTTGSVTDSLGVAAALMLAPNATGDPLQFFGGIAGSSVFSEFDGRVRPIPNIAATGGVVDAISGAAPAGGFAPGSYATIYGTNLSENTMVYSTPYLPVSLAGVSVSFDSPAASVHAPGHLSYVSPSQINVQIPLELAGSSSAVMKVSLSNSSSFDFGRVDDANLGNWQTQLVTIPIAHYSPSFFHYTDSGQSVALAFDEKGVLVGSANAVAQGHYFTTYANGLGLLNGQPASGDPAPTSPLATTAVTPTISIGGQSAQVLFSGLTPGFVGLYQLNVVVPQGISTGLQPMVLTIGGVTASTQIQVK